MRASRRESSAARWSGVKAGAAASGEAAKAGRAMAIGERARASVARKVMERDMVGWKAGAMGGGNRCRVGKGGYFQMGT